MSRQIRLRAWNKDSELMVLPGEDNGEGYPYEFIVATDGIHVESYVDTGHFHEGGGETIETGGTDVHDAVVMQYTGLKDKNDKDVFEGDLLGGIYEGAYVAWCESTGGFEVRTKDYCHACGGDIFWSELVRDRQYVGVIGNIYEHPELLEGLS